MKLLKILDRGLDAVARLVESIVRMVMSVIVGVLRLCGLKPPAISRPARSLSTSPENVSSEYNDRYTKELVNDFAYASDIGMTVHQYASATVPEIRSAIDLGGLTPEQQDWLLMLSDEELGKLATAGPKACELAAAGRKCGVVGLPVATSPAKDVPPAKNDPAGGTMRDRVRERILTMRPDYAGGYGR